MLKEKNHGKDGKALEEREEHRHHHGESVGKVKSGKPRVPFWKGGVGKRSRFLFGAIVGIVFAVIAYVIYRNYLATLISFVAFFVVTFIYFIVNAKLKDAAAIKKMEDVFPDFVGLMASNLRAGMTTDRAMLMSSRKEFAPLDKEILRLGKDIVTGKDMTLALKETGERINSDKIKKTIRLIISGIQSGGDLAVLLEQTAQNMRERNFVQKRAASNVLMYVIFIFFAVAIGAPILFGLSSVLVGILSGILGDLPSDTGSVGLPFTFSEVSVPLTFIFYFSIVFHYH